MVAKISEADAKVMASLIFDDLRGYAKRHPEAHAEYIKQKNGNSGISAPRKRQPSQKKERNIEKN